VNILDRRPIIIALAGPNGAGKSTFYRAYLAADGLRFVNPDQLGIQLEIDVYRAAELADQVRRELVRQGESFIFETVFSDPVRGKIGFLKEAESAGYTVVLFFFGIPSSEVSDQRVAMRVSKGGHDVPLEKIKERYPRVMNNLKRALVELKNVRVYDNSDLRKPYRLVALREEGQGTKLHEPIPQWLRGLLP
jgi:predicted ABC-type ATPase